MLIKGKQAFVHTYLHLPFDRSQLEGDEAETEKCTRQKEKQDAGRSAAKAQESSWQVEQSPTSRAHRGGAVLSLSVGL